MRKFRTQLFAVITFALGSAVLIPFPAQATAPALNWTARQLSTTSSLSTSLSMISEDGSTKVNLASSGGASVYVSRNGGALNLATGTSQLSYAQGGSISSTGQYIVILGNPMGVSNPLVLVSNDYGATFTGSQPFTGSVARNSPTVAMSRDGRTIVLGASTSQNQTGELVTSNDYGATWVYKNLNQSGSPVVAASSASYRGSGKNVIYMLFGGTLYEHVFSSSDSGAIASSMATVAGTNSSDVSILGQVGQIQNFAVSSDGTKVITTSNGTVSSLRNVAVESNGSWTFGTTVSPTYSNYAPSTLGSQNYPANLEEISISPDGQIVGLVVSLYANNNSTLYGYVSRDAGATFTSIFNGASYSSSSKFFFTSESPSKVYVVKGNQAYLSTDGGQNFTAETLNVTSSAQVTRVIGSADGSLLVLTVSSTFGPPNLYFSTDSGATTSLIDATGGASFSYNMEAYVAADGNKLIVNVNNYQNQTNSLVELYGNNFASSRTLNLPSGVTSLGSAVFNTDLSKVLIFARTSGSNGYLYYGTISNGTVTWSSALGDLTSYSSLKVTNIGIHAISVSQSKLYQATISSGTLGTINTNTSPFANGFTGVWSPMSASSDGTKLVVANYGTFSNNCYAGGYVYKSNDSGATWSVIPSGIGSRQVGAPSISSDGTYVAFGVASGGYMNLSQDGGTTFDNLTGLGTLTCAGTNSGVRLWSPPFLYSTDGTNLGIAAVTSAYVLNTTTYSPTAPSLTAQTISFNSLSNMTVGDSDQALTVSASSGLGVSLATANSAVCTIVSSRAHAVGAGTCSITASQAGNSTYSAATNVVRTFTISAPTAPSLTAQTISFNSLSNMTVGDSDQALTVSASSGLGVSLATANSAVCTIVSSRAHAVGAGTCSITASQAGNSTYSAATNVVRTFTISAATPTQSPEELAQQQLAAAIELERIRQLAIAAAKVVLQGVLTSSKPGTLAQFREAGFTIASEAVLNRVNSALLKLPSERRVKVEEINNVIKVESFIVQISTPTTQKFVTERQLINVGLIAESNPNKITLTNALKKRPASTLDSMEKIALAIAEETAVIKARSARLAAIKAKIAARNK